MSYDERRQIEVLRKGAQGLHAAGQLRGAAGVMEACQPAGGPPDLRATVGTRIRQQIPRAHYGFGTGSGVKTRFSVNGGPRRPQIVWTASAGLMPTIFYVRACASKFNWRK